MRRHWRVGVRFRGAFFGASCCASSFQFLMARRGSRTSIVVRASAVVVDVFGLGTGRRLSSLAYGRNSSSITTWIKPNSSLNNTCFFVAWTVIVFRTTCT